MKATGIVRRMDELGRVVIPKEIRRTMHLKEGEELEIYAHDEGLLLKKYSAISALGGLAEEYAQVVQSLLGGAVFVTDTDGVSAAAGTQDEAAIGKPFSAAVGDLLAKRKRGLLSDAAVTKGGRTYANVAVYPILTHGDLFGAIVLGARSAVDAKADVVCETACRLLANQIGD